MRYILTIDRALLDSDPSATKVIRIEDTHTGEITNHSFVALGEGSVIRAGSVRQDGARVWVETEGVASVTWDV
jgi:hypothetical protein